MRPVIPPNRADSTGRITISNIPPGVTEAQLVANLKHHGDAKVHMFVPGCEYTPGWAWISFPSREEVQRILESAYWKARAREEAENSKLPAPASAGSIFAPQKAKTDGHKYNPAADETSEGELTGSGSSDPAYSDSTPGENSDGENI